jgi:glutaredoxin-like protein
MAKMLDENIEKQVKEVFENVQEPVTILFFGSKTQNCDYCNQTAEMLGEIVALSDKLHLEVYDLEENADLAEKYHIDKVPGFTMVGHKDGQIVDYGIRFAGIPAGHEFSSLVHDLVLVSKQDSGLSSETREFLRGLDQPVHLQVFVTPTCPYCPRAVVLAHQMALESDMVQAEMVEATEFPDLANRYGVSGVPHTTINFGAGELIGAVPEAVMIEQIKEALVIQQQ